MSKSFFLYEKELSNEIKKIPFSTNVLEQYDNVVYHANLFTYPADVQRSIDERLAKDGIYEPNYDKRIYICRDGVTTKFTIPSFIMKNVFGNVNSPLNIATYEIKIKIQETLSCMLTNELEVLAYASGYKGYMYLPYWFEIYFSGYKHDTLEPVSKIPLPNGENSLVFKGNFGPVVSHIESSGTTWDISFTPNYNSLINKNTNILSVANSLKTDGKISIENFAKNCVDNMFDRMIYQFAENQKDKDEISKRYSDSNPFIKITINKDKKFYQSVVSKSKTDVTTTAAEDKEKLKAMQEAKNQTSSATKQSGENSSKNPNGVSGNDDGKIEMSGEHSTQTTKINSTEYNTDKATFFTTIFQDFLHTTDNYKAYVVYYNIESKLLEYYNNKPLYSHNVILNIEKDLYIDYTLKKKEGIKASFDRVKFFNECVSNKSLIKRYQYGYSGIDTSVLEAYNKYDNLYFMNSLPSTSREYVIDDIVHRSNSKNSSLDKSKENVATETKKNGEYSNMINNFSSQLSKSYNLEDVYPTLSEKLTDLDYFKLCFLNNSPSINQDLTKDIRRNTTNSNPKTEEKEIMAKLLWERLYRSGQMSETKFKILGDPYWIATQAYRTENNTKITSDYIENEGIKIPNYRCIFTIRSTPDLNQSYSEKNPTDYDFEYSIHASGIYIMVSCESIFEDGKFTQKLDGVMDVRFIREVD